MREEFRHYYYTRHGIRLDDELLLLLMRMSEMHRDLKKEIRRTPPVQFRHGRDYFWYGFGRLAALITILLAATIIMAILYL